MLKYYLVVALGFLTAGCEQHWHNRGGLTDYAMDTVWFKADSKKMRALRAYAIQAILVRLGSNGKMTAPERDIVARRVGNASDRFDHVLDCALKAEPCAIYDSLMSDYETSLFELAMSVFDVPDRQLMFGRLESLVGVSSAGPVSIVHTLAQVGREALRTGRTIGALYRDSVELEVQAWSKTTSSKSEINELIEQLRKEYASGSGDDNMPKWEAILQKLRTLGQPSISEAQFLELYRLIKVSCGMMTGEENAKKSCEKPPKKLEKMAAAQ